MSRKKIGRGKSPTTKKFQKAIPEPNRQEKNWFFLLFILLATIFVYASSLKNDWTNWDDEGYVLKNDLVKSINLKAIFSSFVMGNYHPFTVVMQASVYHFFNDSASAFHTISLVLHIANSLLLYYTILLLTKKKIAAFSCSLVFAIHPQHVESVAWISAQKDLLYTGFYFAAIIFYFHWRQQTHLPVKVNVKPMRAWPWYLCSFFSFIISGLCKAQAVTLPFILLLIDFYLEKEKTNQHFKSFFLNPTHYVNKLPFFIFSIIIGTVAIVAQKESASIQEIQDHSFVIQLLFAAFAFVSYIIKLFLPINLSAYYPYAEKISGAYPFYIYTAPVIVLIIGFLIFRLRKNQPALFFGALFFTVNIFLVLQLLPVGGAVMADRYTYLSSAGIFFLIGIFLNDVWERKIAGLSKYRTPLLAVSVVWILFLLIQTHARTSVWKNSGVLWTDVIKKYPRVPLAQNNLGSYYQKNEQHELAKQHFDAAIRLQPDFVNALINRCDYFRIQNKIDSAIIDGNRAVRLEPDNPEARQNRGIAFSIAGKSDSAMMDFKFVISRQPGNAQVFNNLGNLYSIKEQYDSALVYYNAALKADPSFLDVLNNRGKCYVFLGNYQQALSDLTRAIQINPDNANNYYFRMQAYEKLGRKSEALDDANKVMGLE